jgi:DNA-binding transcriptional ArsR family regulator
METDYLDLEMLFLALGDKTRLKLLALMADGPVAVGFLADRLGESQPKVSRHLAYLRNAGVVSPRRDGKWIYYGIRRFDDPALRRILETIVGSMAAVSVGGEYVYMTDVPTADNAYGSLTEETDVAAGDAEADQAADEFDEYYEDEASGEEYDGRDDDRQQGRPDEEMEVFLL